jgi:haloalkane dehalogenase
MRDSPNGASSRRDVILQSLAAFTAAAAFASRYAFAAPLADQAPSAGGFRERYVRRAGHQLYVRDYPGADPAYVMVHGFPDNCRIYEDIASRLSSAGKRVIAFDFLGFGASDKPDGFPYDFDQQLVGSHGGSGRSWTNRGNPGRTRCRRSCCDQFRHF